jgi:hypothetical protein
VGVNKSDASLRDDESAIVPVIMITFSNLNEMKVDVELFQENYKDEKFTDNIVSLQILSGENYYYLDLSDCSFIDLFHDGKEYKYLIFCEGKVYLSDNLNDQFDGLSFVEY